MDSFPTSFISSYSDKNLSIKQSPLYSSDSEQCFTDMEFYSTNYKSPYNDNGGKLYQRSYKVEPEENITDMGSYSLEYTSLYNENSSRIDQSTYSVKSEECLSNMNTYSNAHGYQYSNNNSMSEKCQYSGYLNTFHPNMESCSPNNSYSQELYDSIKLESELSENVQDFDIFETIDYEDSTWDFSEETWEQFDIADMNFESSFDDLALENTKNNDSPPKVKRRTTKGQAKKKLLKPSKEIKFSADCVEDIIQKTTGAGERERCPHSWEFLMRLLVNSETNPSVIRWEDESQYIFRLVKADSVVQIWNAKSGKASMSKDNFARTLRYHYKRGNLIPVPNKQLVYQCGPKAIEYLHKLRKTL